MRKPKTLKTNLVRTPSITVPYRTAPNTRVYAIGDVHGCAELLDELLQQITADAQVVLDDSPNTELYLIYLGDLVDRGPDSRACIERVMQGPPMAQMTQVVLRGNHEAIMQDILAGQYESFDLWIDNGGRETCQSYGLKMLDVAYEEADHVGYKLNRAVPRSHKAFLSSMENIYRLGDFIFVHAGINPDVPLHAQLAEDLLWIRKPFLNASGDFGAYVVHGHTPVYGADIFENRTNADTGAVYGGALSAAVIDGNEIHLLQVSDGVKRWRAHLQRR